MSDSGEVKDKQKRKRRTVSLQNKVIIIQRARTGERVANIGRDLKISESTIRSILQNSKIILRAAKNSVNLTRVSQVRGGTLEKMEKLLSLWIKEQNQQNIPLNIRIISQKAINIHNQLKTELGMSEEDTPFNASKGWFERFKRRCCIQSTVIPKETLQADLDPDKLPHSWNVMIENGEYTPSLDFKTGLFSKTTPKRTYVSLAEHTDTNIKIETLEEEENIRDNDLEPDDENSDNDDYVVPEAKYGEKSNSKRIKSEDIPISFYKKKMKKEVKQEFPSDVLFKVISAVDEAIVLTDQYEPNEERKKEIIDNLHQSIACYREMYREEKCSKRLSITKVERSVK